MEAEVRRAARQAGDNPVVEWGARLGYLVNGVLHLLIAWLAIQLALGERSASADQSGAMQTLAGSTLGQVTLWAAIAGFALLGLWQLPEAIRVSETSDKVKCLAKAVLYVVLAVSAWGFLDGAGSSSKQQTADFTGKLMAQPFGRALVGAVGLGIIAIGGYHVFKGLKKNFLGDLQEHPGQWAVRAGQFGYVAKGIALAAVGLLFGLSALRNNAAEATGLDGALRKALAMPYGQIGAIVVAIGFILFAVYCAARARYAKV